MPKENRILTIDIGSDCLKMAEFSYPPEGAMRLEKFAFLEYDEEYRDRELSEQFAQTYEKLLSENDFTAKKVRVAVSGQSAFSRLSKLPPLGSKVQHIEQIIEYEAKQTVPYAMDEVVWDYQLILHKTEFEQEPPAPAEAEEVQDSNIIEEMEALFVAVKDDLITELSEIIQDTGKEIISIETAPIAFFNAAKANLTDDNQCDLLLNIGGRCSSLLFADKGRIFTRTIPIAGASITQQISKEFDISLADAEELKCRHGFVALGGAYEEPESEVAAVISKIARNVMTRLHGEINRSINVWRSQYKGNRPGRLFLGGGGSLMAYTPRFFNEKLRIPVEYLNSFQIVALGESIDKEALLDVAPMFSELTGMALRQISSVPVEISLIPDSIKKHKALQRKKPYFYGSAVSVILCLLVFYWVVSKKRNFDKDCIEKVLAAVEKTEQISKEVRSVSNKLDAVVQRYNKAREMADKRSQWPNILNELQTILPDKWWLTSLTATVNKTSTGFANGPGSNREPGIGGSMFGNAPGAGTADVKNVDLNWLKLTGHSVVLRSDLLLDEVFKKRVRTSKYFDNSEDAVVFNSYDIVKGNNNFITFEIQIKLKEPIKK
ncbi:MAG: pilus assembly protein PilM [Victivallales bacterium]|nr:pilus assembly protein PilM [Victivallales bacterium]